MPLDVQETLVQGTDAVGDVVLHREVRQRLALVVADRSEQRP